ncbi:hypothetical protein HK102_002185 [Quaeritorhiza haematococci]|nr:hypothetical protein HK102_002185 [Quaeritorhiza haematococci]
MSDDLATYQYKLEQVEDALSRDPENAELQKLHSDLTELIQLFALSEAATTTTTTASTQPQTEASPRCGSGAGTTAAGDSTSSVPANNAGGGGAGGRKPKWHKGQTVLAKWAGDGQFYEAVVNEVPEDPATGTYTITFSGYGNTEQVKGEDMKHATGKGKSTAGSATDGQQSAGAAGKKRGADDAQKPKKKKKEEAEQVQRQKAWLSFAKGDAKKKKSTAKHMSSLLKNKSIFATPDDPNAKVGVIGSGKPMTQFQQRGKHIFQDDE